MYRFAVVPLTLLAFAFAMFGCVEKKPPVTFESEPDGHSHERDNKLLADAGHYHAALTAHLSGKDGNELHVFFENTDNPPKPAAIPLRAFHAVARRADGKEHELAFVAVAENEREGDTDGKCSHFVAKAPWMKPDDVLKVIATVMINAKPVQVTWKDFSPKKYSQHID